VIFNHSKTMPGTPNKVQKFFQNIFGGGSSSSTYQFSGPNWNPFAQAAPYQDKFRDTLDKIRLPASAISTAASFIPVVGPFISGAIGIGVAAAEAGDKIKELNEAGFDWSYLYDWEGFADDPEAQKLFGDVMSGRYNSPGPAVNKFGGDFSGNFHY
jgi:hypothetical protein